ncbi:hypothetical protein QP905_08145 [Corynebacterium pseudodiphtheriticum]|uniref:hypothetical protein n=1 Tax=Corynebacterium pseudodiphtheriticum TaxID=37637 RepID=UPI00254D1431|nr:hypothetical protein [Corynebacterium pseudodiphtheriticum]MDK8578316.1 hypothetical protein [Corynebacterium pseudodiphtheriticum]
MSVIDQYSFMNYAYGKRQYPSSALYILTADIKTADGMINRPLQSHSMGMEVSVYATDNHLAADVWRDFVPAKMVEQALNDPETGLVGHRIRNIRTDEILGTVEHVKVGVMKAEYEVKK